MTPTNNPGIDLEKITRYGFLHGSDEPAGYVLRSELDDLLARQAAPVAPTQQTLRDGYKSSTMVSDFHGPKITLRYATSAQADAAHAVLCAMLDATHAATTASASIGNDPKFMELLYNLDTAQLGALYPEAIKEIITYIDRYAPQAATTASASSDATFIDEGTSQEAQAAHAGADTDAAQDVLAERRRQIEVEGWAPARDDQYVDYSLARAAATYAIAATADRADRAVMDDPHTCGITAELRRLWPASWAPKWLKPKSRRADLVRAGALILAEIERIDRAAITTSEQKGPQA